MANKKTVVEFFFRILKSLQEPQVHFVLTLREQMQTP